MRKPERPLPLWRRGFIAEDVLDLLGPIAVRFEQDGQRLAKLLEPRFGIDQSAAAGGALDPVQVRRQ